MNCQKTDFSLIVAVDWFNFRTEDIIETYIKIYDENIKTWRSYYFYL